MPAKGRTATADMVNFSWRMEVSIPSRRACSVGVTVALLRCPCTKMDVCFHRLKYFCPEMNDAMGREEGARKGATGRVRGGSQRGYRVVHSLQLAVEGVPRRPCLTFP